MKQVLFEEAEMESPNVPMTSGPWWLGGGERCPHCCQHYVFEAEYRCTTCDGPSCSLCAVVIGEVVVCPSCSELNDGDECEE